MVFGRNSEYKNDWHPYYAWRPVRLLDGRWAWFQNLERINYMSRVVPAGAIHTIIGMWCFRLPTNNY